MAQHGVVALVILFLKTLNPGERRFFAHKDFTHWNPNHGGARGKTKDSFFYVPSSKLGTWGSAVFFFGWPNI